MYLSLHYLPLHFGGLHATRPTWRRWDRGCSAGSAQFGRNGLDNGIRYDFAVTAAAETLLEQALTLPLEDRALLASGLLASLDSERVEDADVDTLWSAETERRATMLASGEAGLVTWDHLVSRIDERRA